MALFQVSVLKNYLKLQDDQAVDKAYKSFTSYFHHPEIQENIRKSKEEQFQATFLHELFVKVLGYTLNPNPAYNLTTEFRNESNNRKADGAILKDGSAIGVIELKGTNTKHLEGIRQQAFDYKANQKHCVYVITSNFEKLRFYIQDATEFLEFDLFELNRKDFGLLWLCLHKENILGSLPLKIKEASLGEEEEITKEFYKDYSLFKRELFRDLVQRNVERLKNEPSDYGSDAHPPSQMDRDVSGSEVDTEAEKDIKLNLFKKSQKLIDRFLFIFFAEDRGLLPPNAIVNILAEWNQLKDLDAEIPLYERFKQYFGYLNHGRPANGNRPEIYAYNGGLFKPDELLDGLEIDDELLNRHTSKLAKYDFESQVDVNILGHIFENSLNEIESVSAEIEGGEFDKQKSKRKKDGVFYTPKYITKYIVENTIGRICEEKKSELGFREEEYFKGRKRRQKDTLEGLVKILDDYRDWLLQLTICDPACGSGAFLNQALDFLIKEHRYIDEMKSKLLGGSIILSDIENTILERNIYGVDINEESVEIAKLSLWLRTAQPNRKLNDLSGNIKCGNSLIDDEAVAGNKAFKWEEEFPEVFSKGGFDVVIGNPPYVQTSDKNFSSYKTFKCGDLYALFFERGLEITREKGYFSFITPSLFIKGMRYEVLRNFLLDNSRIIEIADKGDNIFEGVQMPTAITTLQKERIKNQSWKNFIPGGAILEKLESNSVKIGEVALIMRGLEIGKDKVSKTNGEIPFLTGEDVDRFGVKSTSYISEAIYNEYCKDSFYFTGERLSIRETGSRITSIFLDYDIQQNRSLYSIKIPQDNNVKPLFLLAVLNSKVIQFYYSNAFAANTGVFPKIRIGQVKNLPLKMATEEDQNNIQLRSEKLTKNFELLQAFLGNFYNFFSKTIGFSEDSKKLQSWHELEFGAFIKELNKAIKASNKVRLKDGLAPVPELTKKDEFEWMELFEENKQKAVALQREIEKTDREIDRMVYELYDLTEEEIEIVENSTK
ncbi:N-6 DNA methylase [Salinimicrobium sp. CDJ15-81-2]|nr:N-6 DNA methylase [Salinimicrobium nanhaiense]